MTTTTTTSAVATPCDPPNNTYFECANCGGKIDVAEDEPGKGLWVHDRNGQAACVTKGEREQVVVFLAHNYDPSVLIEALAYQLKMPVPF